MKNRFYFFCSVEKQILYDDAYAWISFQDDSIELLCFILLK
jgi:hypothetical protein